MIDGDTIEIRSQGIRLHGIDAPERSQTCKDSGGRTYRYGQHAAFVLADRIGASPLECAQKGKDRCKRFMAVCTLNGADLNGWTVQLGWALAYQEFSSDYIPQEVIARATMRGMWTGQFTPPWEWRAQIR